MRKLLLVAVSVLASGCTAKYVQNDLSQPAEKLLSGAPVTIAQPADGSYDGSAYKASGAMTAAAVRAAFARHSNAVVVNESCANLSCIRPQGATGYYVVPEILHWEDRATEWSGIPDRIEVKLDIYGPQGDTPLASTLLSGKSKWATFGGDHPQDLLEKPVTDYVQSQY